MLTLCHQGIRSEIVASNNIELIEALKERKRCLRKENLAKMKTYNNNREPS